METTFSAVKLVIGEGVMSGQWDIMLREAEEMFAACTCRWGHVRVIQPSCRLVVIAGPDRSFLRLIMSFSGDGPLHPLRAAFPIPGLRSLPKMRANRSLSSGGGAGSPFDHRAKHGLEDPSRGVLNDGTLEIDLQRELLHASCSQIERMSRFQFAGRYSEGHVRTVEHHAGRRADDYSYLGVFPGGNGRGSQKLRDIGQGHQIDFAILDG